MKDGRNTDLYLDLAVVGNLPKSPILMRYADKLHGMTHRDTALPGTWHFLKGIVMITLTKHTYIKIIKSIFLLCPRTHKNKAI